MDKMLLRVFQAQAAFQCDAVVAASRQLETARSPTDTFIAIQNMLMATANVSKALWGSGGKLAAERKALRDSLTVADDSPLSEVDMRNNFEHFDERLDLWWKNSPSHNFIDMNVGIDIPLHDELDKFRDYDPATGLLTFWGQEFNIPEIVAEAARVLPIAQAEANKPHW